MKRGFSFSVREGEAYGVAKHGHSKMQNASVWEIAWKTNGRIDHQTDHVTGCLCRLDANLARMSSLLMDASERASRFQRMREGMSPSCTSILTMGVQPFDFPIGAIDMPLDAGVRFLETLSQLL